MTRAAGTRHQGAVARTPDVTLVTGAGESPQTRVTFVHLTPSEQSMALDGEGVPIARNTESDRRDKVGERGSDRIAASVPAPPGPHCVCCHSSVSTGLMIRVNSTYAGARKWRRSGR